MISALNSALIAPRIKPLPKGLIYRVPKSDIYHLIETRTGELVGKMVAFPITNGLKQIYDVPQESKVFRVYSLKIDPLRRNEKWGSYFMQFAKNESNRQECDGRLYLVAYNSEYAPHVFYKKQGLKAVDKRMDQKLNEFIKKNENPIWLPSSEMYLPIEEKEKEIKCISSLKQNSFIKDLKNFFKNIFIKKES